NISVTVNLNHRNDNEVELYLIPPGGACSGLGCNSTTINPTTPVAGGNGAVLTQVLPTGGGILLVADQGNQTAPGNYTNTVFSSTASTSITGGSPPFTGTFLPQTGTFNYPAPIGGSFTSNGFSSISGSPVAGTWTLIVVDDDATGVSGVFGSFTIS